MSKADILIALLLVLGAVLGYRRGFLMEFFLLAAIVLGIFIGFRLMGAGVEYLRREFNADASFLPYISFALIFLVVLVGVTFLGRRVKDLVDHTFLGRADALAGALLGMIKYFFCLSVILWILSSFHLDPPVRWTQNSWLYPAATRFAPRVAALVGGFLPFFREIFREF